MPDRNWTSLRENAGYDASSQSREDFEHSHRDKPIKAIIGIVVLMVLALVFSRMNPAPHNVSTTPAATGQTTGAVR